MAKSEKNKSKWVHLLADFFNADADKLRSEKKIMCALRKALRKNHFRIIKSGSYKFKTGGQGVTGFFMLAQSHAAFHSYPEYGYLALDIYSCGGHNPKPIAEEIKKYLGKCAATKIIHKRGSNFFKHI
ncbi:MAG: S-adenosylmethionine decarboxylase [Candidatus Omnitrophica bacterium]|nr:S-adenosylmethionine decarboxylase [Candidatus Omnitrophota bacterium]